MILRFKNKENGSCINIDTSREEQSEAQVAGKNYIELDSEDFLLICGELDFNCYNCQKLLTVDGGENANDEDLPLW